MALKETTFAKGEVTVNLIKDGQVVETIFSMNHLVNNGKAFLARALKQPGTTKIDALKAGLGTTATTDTMTSLESTWTVASSIAQGNIALTPNDTNPTGIKITSTIAPTAAELGTLDQSMGGRAPIREIGLFYDNGTTMFSRLVLPAAATIDTSLGLQIIWIVTFHAYTE